LPAVQEISLHQSRTSPEQNFTIDKKINCKIISKSRTTKDATSIVKKEFAIFEIEGKRGANHDFYSSMVAWNKNVFFHDVDCGRTVAKIRSSLNYEILDILTFLRGRLTILVPLFAPNLV
jgi:hypothetical protein